MLPWAAHLLPGSGSGRRSRRPAASSKCARMSRSRGSERDCTGHREVGEIASASGTRDHRWTVMTWAWTPAGDLNARSRVGIIGSACSNRPDSGPSRVAGSQLASDAQRLERRLAPSTRPLASMERPVGFASLGPNGPPGGWCPCVVQGVPTYWVWGPSGEAFDYPFADWRGPTGGWGNP